MNNNYDKYLPIGTIVLIKDVKKRFMITGFRILSKNDNNVVYDYCGCTYPEGVINFDKVILFNHNQIEKIYFMGFRDQEELSFKNNLDDILKNRNLLKQ